MTVEKRLENALSISESIKNGKISPNNLYDLQLHLSDALDQVKELSNTKCKHKTGLFTHTENGNKLWFTCGYCKEKMTFLQFLKKTKHYEFRG